MRFLWMLVGAVILTGCQATANYDYDETANFNAIKSFAWVDESKQFDDKKNNLYLNELLHNRVKNAVEQQLTNNGLRKVAAGDADILVNYHASVDKKLEPDLMSTHYAVHQFNRRFYGHHYLGYPVQYVEQREFKSGTLIIDVMDRDNKLIWRGSKESRILQSKSPQERTAKINETIGLILSNFPPMADKSVGS